MSAEPIGLLLLFSQELETGLVGKDVLLSSAAVEAPTITLDYALIGADFSLTNGTVERPSIIQVHILAGTDVALSAGLIEAPGILQEHALTGLDITIAQSSVEKPTMTQVHTLIGTDLFASGAVLETAVISQNHVVPPIDLLLAVPVIEAPSLSVAASLVAQDLTLSTPLVDAPVINQLQALSSKNFLLSAPMVETPAVGTFASLTGKDMAVPGASVEEPVISQVHALVGKTISNTVVVEEPSLSVYCALAGKDLILSVPLIERPSISQVHVLTGNDLVSSPSVETPTITQVHAFTCADLILSPPVMEAPSMGSSTALNGKDLVSLMLIEAPSISQNHVFALSDVLISPALIDKPSIFGNIGLTGANILLAQAIIDKPIISQVHALAGKKLLLSSASVEQPSIAQDQALPGRDVFLCAPLIDKSSLTIYRSVALENSVFSETGPAVLLAADRILLAGTQSYTLEGIEALTVEINHYSISLETGMFAVAHHNAGIEIDRVLSAEKNTLGLLGKGVTLSALGLTHRNLTMGGADFTLVGAVNIRVARLVVAGKFECSASNMAATLKLDRVLVFAAEGLALLGKASDILPGWRVLSDTGTLTLTTFPLGAEADRQLPAEVQAYSVVGENVQIGELNVNQYTLVTGVGNFSSTLVDISLKASRVLPGSKAVFTESSVGADLYHGSLLVGGVTAYAVDGHAAGLGRGASAVLDAGSIIVSGQGIGYARLFRLEASPVNFSLSGAAVAIYEVGAYEMVAYGSPSLLSGNDTFLLIGRTVQPVPGMFEIDRAAVGLSLTRVLPAATLTFTYQIRALVKIVTSVVLEPASYMLTGKDVEFLETDIFLCERTELFLSDMIIGLLYRSNYKYKAFHGLIQIGIKQLGS